MKNIKRLQALVLLSIGIAVSAYSLLAMIDFTSSARAILMMGSRYEPGSVVPDRIIAAVFLFFLLAVGMVLIGISIKKIVESYKK